MTTTLHYIMIKNYNTRGLSYTTKGLKSLLDNLQWAYREDPVATKMIFFTKTFDDDQQAITGRKTLEERLRLFNGGRGYRLEQVTRS